MNIRKGDEEYTAWQCIAAHQGEYKRGKLHSALIKEYPKIFRDGEKLQRIIDSLFEKRALWIGLPEDRVYTEGYVRTEKERGNIAYPVS